MKRLLLLLTLVTGFLLEGFSQQLPIFSLYRDNSFVLNPAITGSEGYPIASLTYRDQWAGVDGRPRTMSANFNTQIEKFDMGLGGQIINDVTGPTAFTGVTFSYAYHIKFYKRNPFKWPPFLRKSTISIGLSASVFQYRLNSSELILDQANDQAVNSEDNTRVMPNAGVGIYYYYDNFYLGYAAPQLIPINLNFEGVDGASNLQRINHHYIVVGGQYALGPNYKPTVTLQPMVWFKYVKGAPFQIDAHMRVQLRDFVWLGVAYRTSNVLVAEAGFLIKNQFKIGYAYDINVSNTSAYLGGAHEFILAYRFGQNKSPY